MDSDQPTDSELKVRETGLNRPTLPTPGPLPAGGGTWAVPHHLEFVGLVNQFARAYRWTFDEAQQNCHQNAVAMRNDVVLMEALRERQMMTAQLGWHLEARDETDPNQVAGAKLIEEILRDTPNFQKMLMLLLEAVWYGRFGVQVLFEWDQFDSSRLKIKSFSPINGDSLVYRWSGDWGLLVNGQFEGDRVPTDRGYAHFFTEKEREVVIIHTHEPEAADYYAPNQAGAIAGVGVRGRVYWYWWLKNNFLSLLADYSERFAYGVWLAYYDQNNPNGKIDMENAIAGYKANRVVMIPRTENGQTPYGLEIKDPPTAPPQILTGLIEYFDSIMRRFILGMTVADGVSFNVGGDGANLLQSRIARVVKFDACNLAETLTEQLCTTLARWNTPGLPPPKFVFDVDVPNASAVIGYAQAIAELGGEIPLDHLYYVCGIPKPATGDNIASKLQPLSPVAATSTPQNVPIVGNTGPTPNQPQPLPATAQINNA